MGALPGGGLATQSVDGRGPVWYGSWLLTSQGLWPSRFDSCLFRLASVCKERSYVGSVVGCQSLEGSIPSLAARRRMNADPLGILRVQIPAPHICECLRSGTVPAFQAGFSGFEPRHSLRASRLPDGEKG